MKEMLAAACSGLVLVGASAPRARHRLVHRQPHRAVFTAGRSDLRRLLLRPRTQSHRQERAPTSRRSPASILGRRPHRPHVDQREGIGGEGSDPQRTGQPRASRRGVGLPGEVALRAGRGRSGQAGGRALHGLSRRAQLGQLSKNGLEISTPLTVWPWVRSSDQNRPAPEAFAATRSMASQKEIWISPDSSPAPSTSLASGE
jgi:hypothetical protein